jgi:hypothetical protein
MNVMGDILYLNHNTLFSCLNSDIITSSSFLTLLLGKKKKEKLAEINMDICELDHKVNKNNNEKESRTYTNENTCLKENI